jgi:hypothetical protein
MEKQNIANWLHAFGIPPNPRQRAGRPIRPLNGNASVALAGASAWLSRRVIARVPGGAIGGTGATDGRGQLAAMVIRVVGLFKSFLRHR